VAFPAAIITRLDATYLKAEAVWPHTRTYFGEEDALLKAREQVAQ
jgi:hypothetical protein